MNNSQFYCESLIVQQAKKAIDQIAHFGRSRVYSRATTMTRLCFIFGDQLNEHISSLAAINKEDDVVFLCEVIEEATYVSHHPKKIAFLFAAMRHFADELREKGYKVRYSRLDDNQNEGSFVKELHRAIREEHCLELCLTEPAEWRVLEMVNELKNQLTIPMTVYEDNRFLCSITDFKEWAKGKKQLRMEFFYRMMRQKHQVLLDEKGGPEGGSWNYDAQNRKNANHIAAFPQRLEHEQDAITQEVLALVSTQFSHHFGQLHPFNFAVTRSQALAEVDYFIEYCLDQFGDYQDAMLSNETSLYHSKLSFYLNAGLLEPLELCYKAEQAYKTRGISLNSVEGFIRQIIGWREYVRGIYWLHMPEYAHLNYFNASRPLPAMYWGGDTKMHCMQEAIRHTSVEAYSHHIQRLMITGNFALISGLDPKEVCAWYLAVYADAYEWVELPNTLGMALYGDGGIMASKPYAASGKYIHRMSNFCKSCYYNPNDSLGEKACPFNSLYWNFIDQNEEKLKSNPRLFYVYSNWKKMTPDKKEAILVKAKEILTQLDSSNL